MKKVTRRRLLFGLATVGAGVVTAVIGFRYTPFVADRARKFVRGVVRYHFPPSRISDEVLDRFVADFQKRNAFPDLVNRGLGLVGLLPYGQFRRVSLFVLGSKAEEHLYKIESRIFTSLLLSSTYFDIPNVGNAPVEYLQFYDPYESPCANPLARLVDQ